MPTNSLTVFIADDSALIRERLVGLLAGQEGIEVVGQAQDAQEAIASIRRLLPQAVILDLHMPGGGFQVLQDLQQEDIDPVVIVLTNYSDPPYRQKAVEAGADYFFDKSTEFSKVKRVLQSLLPLIDKA